MITIVTGTINSGKSTWLRRFYQQRGIGDGISNLKIFSGSSYIGQRIVRLSNSDNRVFALKTNYLPSGWREHYLIQNYSFCTEGIEFANKLINNFIKEGVSPIYIDEIGPLELKKEGLYQAFRELLQCNREIYVVVRENCVDEVVKTFNITHFSKFQIKI